MAKGGVIYDANERPLIKKGHTLLCYGKRLSFLKKTKNRL